MRRSFVAVVPRRCFAAAFTVVLVAAAFAAQSSPARTTSVATGSAASTKVVSTKYGYTAVLPGRWFVHYAVTQWLGGFMWGDGTPDLDTISNSQDRTFNVAAKTLSAATTLEDWAAPYLATVDSMHGNAGKPLCKKWRAPRDTTLGGAPARQFENVCGPGYDVIVVAAVHRGRGYALQFLSPTAKTAPSDRRTFDAARRSFRFAAP
jgi:hypothetical protein